MGIAYGQQACNLGNGVGRVILNYVPTLGLSIQNQNGLSLKSFIHFIFPLMLKCLEGEHSIPF